MSQPFCNFATSSSTPFTLPHLEGQYETNLEIDSYDEYYGPSAGAPYARHPAYADSGHYPTVAAPQPRVPSTFTGYADNGYPTIVAHTGYAGNEYPTAVATPRHEETYGYSTIVAPRPRVPSAFAGYADGRYATAMASPPRVAPTLRGYEVNGYPTAVAPSPHILPTHAAYCDNGYPTAVAQPPRVPPTHAVYCDNGYSTVLVPRPHVPPTHAGYGDNEYHATMALPPHIPPTHARCGDNGYPTAVAPPSCIPPPITGYAGNGYLTAMSPPPRISKYGRLAMALSVPQQRTPVAEQHCYGSQGVDPHAVNAWGQPRYGTVDGFVFPESINTIQNIGHIASSAIQGNVDAGHMSLNQHGLMETTESPHPIRGTFVHRSHRHMRHTTPYDTASAHRSHHMRHPRPHETAVAQPPISLNTLPPAVTFTIPTCALSYQEASGSATQVSTTSSPSPTPPHIVAPGRTQSQPSSSGGSHSVSFADDQPAKFDRMNAPPERKPAGREEGARMVLWEQKAIAAKLKSKTLVNLDSYYYITTWDIYDNITNHFLRCEEKGCRYVLKKGFHHRCGTFKTHLRTHAAKKVVRLAGETKESHERRQTAAGDAKVGESKYVTMMERFKSLIKMVEEAAERRRHNNTLM